MKKVLTSFWFWLAVLLVVGAVFWWRAGWVANTAAWLRGKLGGSAKSSADQSKIGSSAIATGDPDPRRKYKRGAAPGSSDMASDPP